MKYAKELFLSFILFSLLMFSPAVSGEESKTKTLPEELQGDIELVNLPKGTRVHSNRDSRNMIANSGQRGGTINNINITVNAKDTSKAEMDRIAREISRSITNNISSRLCLCY